MPDFVSRYQWEGPPRIVFESAEVQGADGATYRHHRLRAGTGGAVMIARGVEGVLFVRTSRPAVDGEVFLELPRGWLDPGESSGDVTAAVREMAEETGHTAVDARVVGIYVLDTGIYPQPVTVVTCRVPRRDEPSVTDGEADGGSEWVPADGVFAAVRSGRVRDAHSLSALALWAAEGEQKEL